jgi:hypothetical protein
VLLCPPDHYRWIDTNSIAHSTLTRRVQFDPNVAKAQYAGMVEVLERAGVRCHFLIPDPEHPYQVYTRDSSQTTPWGPVLTQLRMPARRGEYAAVLDFHLPQDGFWHYATSGTCEGVQYSQGVLGVLTSPETSKQTKAERAWRAREQTNKQASG